jgi:hypothetical protein
MAQTGQNGTKIFKPPCSDTVTTYSGGFGKILGVEIRRIKDLRPTHGLTAIESTDG